MVIGPGNFAVVDGDHTAVKPLIEIGLRVARWACAGAADGDRAAAWAGRSAIGMCGGCRWVEEMLKCCSSSSGGQPVRHVASSGPESLFDRSRSRRNIRDLAPILVSTPFRAETIARQASCAKNQPEVQ